MPAAVPFETAAEMFLGLEARYRGAGKAALGYRDRATKEWVDVSWDELSDQVRALAAFLVARGIQPGDRVAILSENRPEWAVTDLATQLVGAVNVGIYPTLPPAQVAGILRDSGARAVVASTAIQVRKATAALAEVESLGLVVAMSTPKGGETENVVTWEAALAEGTAFGLEDDIAARAAAVTPDSLSALIYTSGTTGEPKGVVMTHRALMTNIHAVHAHVDVFEDDVHLSFLPLSHAFERTTGYGTVLSAGGQIVYAESTDTVVRDLPEVSPTLLVSVPRLFEKVFAAVQKSVAEGGAAKKAVFGWAVGVGTAVARRKREGHEPGLILGAQHALAHRLAFAPLHEKLGGRLRFAVSGGAALPADVGAFFEAAGVALIEGYGLSETAPVLAANALSDAPRGHGRARLRERHTRHPRPPLGPHHRAGVGRRAAARRHDGRRRDSRPRRLRHARLLEPPRRHGRGVHRRRLVPDRRRRPIRGRLPPHHGPHQEHDRDAGRQERLPRPHRGAPRRRPVRGPGPRRR